MYRGTETRRGYILRGHRNERKLRARVSAQPKASLHVPDLSKLGKTGTCTVHVPKHG